ncbi:MAG: hypothetical protein AAFQ02_03690 [Bacteroidota bacterium]
MRLISVGLFIGAILSLASCDGTPSLVDANEVVVAEVGSSYLYQSALDKVVHPDASPVDSTAVANAYLDQWLRDQLLMREASRFFSSDFEIDRLVQDYRGSLLKYRLEEKIMTERYDTTLSEGEMEAFYEEMQQNFILQEPLYRCIYAQFDRDTESLRQFYKDWKADDELSVRTFAAAFGESFISDTTIWYGWDDISEWYDGFNQTIATRSGDQRQLDRDYEYYLKVIDVAAARTPTPLGYIEPQIKQMLLHRRKQELLESYNQELYERALNDNLIQIH